MPLLTYSNSDFVNGTTADADAVNTRFSDIRTLLNTTKLDSTNIQDGGVSRAKLAAGTLAHALLVNDASSELSEVAIGTAGQVLTVNPTATGYVFAANSTATIEGTVVGSAAQVASSVANYDNIADAITNTSAGDTITVLPEYATTENVTLAASRRLIGKGPNSEIDGTITVSGNECIVDNLSVTGKITTSGSNNYVGAVWSNQTNAGDAVEDTGTDNFILSVFLS